MFLMPVQTVRQALDLAFQKYGSDAKIIIMPEAPKVAVNISE